MSSRHPTPGHNSRASSKSRRGSESSLPPKPYASQSHIGTQQMKNNGMSMFYTHLCQCVDVIEQHIMFKSSLQSIRDALHNKINGFFDPEGKVQRTLNEYGAEIYNHPLAKHKIMLQKGSLLASRQHIEFVAKYTGNLIQRIPIKISPVDPGTGQPAATSEFRTIASTLTPESEFGTSMIVSIDRGDFNSIDQTFAKTPTRDYTPTLKIHFQIGYLREGMADRDSISFTLDFPLICSIASIISVDGDFLLRMYPFPEAPPAPPAPMMADASAQSSPKKVVTTYTDMPTHTSSHDVQTSPLRVEQPPTQKIPPSHVAVGTSNDDDLQVSPDASPYMDRPQIPYNYGRPPTQHFIAQLLQTPQTESEEVRRLRAELQAQKEQLRQEREASARMHHQQLFHHGQSQQMSSQSSPQVQDLASSMVLSLERQAYGGKSLKEFTEDSLKKLEKDLSYISSVVGHLSSNAKYPGDSHVYSRENTMKLHNEIRKNVIAFSGQKPTSSPRESGFFVEARAAQEIDTLLIISSWLLDALSQIGPGSPQAIEKLAKLQRFVFTRLDGNYPQARSKDPRLKESSLVRDLSQRRAQGEVARKFLQVQDLPLYSSIYDFSKIEENLRDNQALLSDVVAPYTLALHSYRSYQPDPKKSEYEKDSALALNLGESYYFELADKARNGYPLPQHNFNDPVGHAVTRSYESLRASSARAASSSAPNSGQLPVWQQQYLPSLFTSVSPVPEPANTQGNFFSRTGLASRANDCCPRSTTRALQFVLRRLPLPLKLLTKIARKLIRQVVDSAMIKEIASLINITLDGTPLSAKQMMAELLEKFPVLKEGNDVLMLKEFIRAEPYAPSNSIIFSAVVWNDNHFDACIHKSNGIWVRHHDATDGAITRIPLHKNGCLSTLKDVRNSGEVQFWIFAADRYGQGPATGATCNVCGKLVDNHTMRHFFVRCSKNGCMKTAYGTCTGSSSHEIASSSLLGGKIGSSTYNCSEHPPAPVSAPVPPKRKPKKKSESSSAPAARAPKVPPPSSAQAKTVPSTPAVAPHAPAAGKKPLSRFAAAFRPSAPAQNPPAHGGAQVAPPTAQQRNAAPQAPRPQQRSAKAYANRDATPTISTAPNIVNCTRRAFQATEGVELPLNPLVFVEEISDNPQDFRRGCSNAQTEAELPGQYLIDHNLTTDHSAHLRQVWAGRHPQTSEHHLITLLASKILLKKAVARNPSWAKVPLSVVLIQVLIARAKARRWLPQTSFREACNLVGAFRNLQLYSPSAKTPVFLGYDAWWKNAMATFKSTSQRSQPQNQVAVTALELMKSLEFTPDLQTSVALILQWFLAGRVGDICGLKLKDLTIEPQTRLLKATFRDAKTVDKRGCYTVNSYLPSEHLEMLRRHLELRSAEVSINDPVFSVPVAKLAFDLRHALCQVPYTTEDGSPRLLSTRAIRRGALQAMALKKVPIPALMKFSGHTNETTLKRYLDWGRTLKVEEDEAEMAAFHLAPEPLQQVPPQSGTAPSTGFPLMA